MRLLVVGTLAIVIALYNIKIVEDPSAMGIKLTNLGDAPIREVLAAIIAYLWIHYFWHCCESWKEFSLRRSGASLQSPSSDFTHDQTATLYGWWLTLDPEVKDKAAPELEKRIKRFEWRYAAFISSQNWRWLIFEAGLPLLVGGIGFISMVVTVVAQGGPAISKPLPALIRPLVL